MDITVYYKEENNPEFLPRPVRALIVGTSGCGKTNLLLNLICKENGIKFKYLYVFSKSIEQKAYAELREHYDRVESKTGKKIAYFFANCEDLIPLDECQVNSLVVFDDCLMEEQTKIKDYFIRGRHKKISCVYLSQSYGKVDMQVIRNNVNFLCIFNQNKHYTKRIYQDFVGSDMTFDQFENMCQECWEEPHGFLTINMTKKSHNGKYVCMLKRDLNVKTLTSNVKT